MQVKTTAIVISAIKYQEKSLIVKCFTKSDGLKTYFVRDAFSQKKSNQKIAYFQPLNILEIEAVHKNKGNMESFKEIKLAIPYQTISSNVIKSSIAFFLAEILSLSIHEEEKNEDLYQFLEAAFQWLDSHSEIANFHLILLVQMTKFLGFYPDVSNHEAVFFNLVEGQFTPIHTYNCLSQSETELLKKLLSQNFESESKTFNNHERQVLIKILIEYYTLHISAFRKPKTLEILQEIFA